MKFYPANMPKPLQASYSVKHKPNMIRTQMSDGYTRQRLVNQGAPDQVQVTLLLHAELYREFLQWYKADIQSGASWFVMPLLSTDEDSEIQYRYVRIQNGELDVKLLTTTALFGSIYHVGFTLDASNTVVDDGSWEDHYLPTGPTDDETGEVTIVDSARIISDVDDLGDSSGTYTIIEE